MRRTIWRWTHDFVLDIRLAWRNLGSDPGFSLIVILTIALGAGANTAVFGVARQVLFAELPVHRPEQLVELDCIDRTDPEEGQCDASWPGFQMYAQNAPLLSGLFAYSAIADVNLVREGRGQLVSALLASGDAYQVLGVMPLHGRLLNPQDDNPGASPVAVLSHAAWRDHFDADPSIVGQSIRLNERVVTVVGVTPPAFSGITFGEAADVTLSMGASTDLFLGPGALANGTNWWLKVIGRMRDDVSREQVQASLAPVFQRTVDHMVAAAGAEGPRYRESLKSYDFRLRSAADGGFSELRFDLGSPVRILLLLVSFVLVVACANLAGLLLSRMSARRREIALRVSLGAGRLRLARQFWAESILLCGIGGASGVVAGQWVTPAFLKMAAGERLLRTFDAGFSSGLVMYALAILLLTSLLIGAAPVFAMSIAPIEALRDGKASARTSTLGSFLVPAQLTVAALLMIGAGLFIRTLDNIRHVDLGYRSDNLVTLTPSPDIAGYDEARRDAYWTDVLERVSALPGVSSVTLSADPIGELNRTTVIDVPGFESAAPQERSTGQKLVGPGFVKTAGLRLLQGNDLTAADASSPRRVAIVNASFARHFFNTTGAVGREFRFTLRGAQVPVAVVGVVADARDRNPRTTPERVVYSLTPARFLGSAAVGVRTQTDAASPAAPALMIGAIRSAVAAVDPAVPLREIRTVSDQIDEALGRDRVLAGVGGLFGGLALLLAAVGLYGLLAGNVARRAREIGIRMALGARKESVIWMVLREGLTLTAIGLGAGLASGVILSRYVESQLFGVEPHDAVTLAGVAGVLLLTGTLAALLPARRASRIEPVVALSRE